MRGGFRTSPKPCSSDRIALCTVTPEGRACCSFDEGAFAYAGGLTIAIDEARAHAERGYYCACVRRNVGVGVMIFSIEPDGVDRVIGVTRYEPTEADLLREREDRAARSARVRLIVEAIAIAERARPSQRRDRAIVRCALVRANYHGCMPDRGSDVIVEEADAMYPNPWGRS